MKRLIPLCILLGLLACHREIPKTAMLGKLKVSLAIEPDPPVSGENHLDLELHDSSGQPVDRAKIDLVYDMPAMGAMPEMKGNGQTRSTGPGKYVVTYHLPMGGDWMLTLSIHAPGHPTQELHTKVSTARKGFVLGGDEAGEVSHPAGSGQAPLLEIPPRRQQLIGVTYATVERRPLAVRTRAAGRIEVDERRVADVTLKYEAYVRELLVDETGRSVRVGQPLALVYSPDLLASEEQFLQARHAALSHAAGTAEIARGAMRRLRFWDLSEAQVEAIIKAGKADGTLVIRSPASGVVLEKDVVNGTHLMPGTVLYRVGNLGRVWVQSDFYENDASWIAVGQPATIRLPVNGTGEIRGRVSFVYPTLDEKTRTLRARIDLQNAGLDLKPGMYADVTVSVPLGEKLCVPDSALLLSGEHRYAFVERGPGTLQAVEVQVGALAEGYDVVRSGLEEGDRVATGANFLLSSEAQLRDALPRWSAP